MQAMFGDGPSASGGLREEYLARARDLVPKLRERAGRAEELRRLPDETERDFHDTGLFRFLQPRRVGGAELDFGMIVDLGAEIARGCGSSAWNLTNLGSHHWMLGMFPKAVQDEIWDAAPDMLIASSFIFPAGKARVEGDGYILSGRWPFSSGVDICGWNMLAGLVGGGEKPEYRVFLLPRSDYRIIDTWHVSGLVGTGSKDVEARDVFVPAYRTLAVADIRGGPTPGSAINPGSLFRLPVFAVFPYVLSGTALGIAEGALADHVAATRDRVSQYTGARVGDFQAVHMRIGEAGAQVHTARRIMQEACTEATAIAEAGQVPDMATRMRYRRDGAFAVQLCVRAVDLVFGASGGAGLYLRNPLQRAFRDAHAVQAHITFNTDVAFSGAGRFALGLGVENPTL